MCVKYDIYGIYDIYDIYDIYIYIYDLYVVFYIYDISDTYDIYIYDIQDRAGQLGHDPRHMFDLDKDQAWLWT